MEKPVIDLHMHSLYSDDGEFSPEELVRQCAAQGIRVMAIADHNCAKANAGGQRAATAAGIAYIPAIEIDCTFRGTDLHLLGYGIDFESADFEAIEQNIARQSKEASLQRLAATRRLGFAVSEEEMHRFTEGRYWQYHWTGEMFAEILLRNPAYDNHPLLAPYRPGGARADNPYVNFYWDYYAQGKPCHAAVTYPTLEEAVGIVHRNGGLAALAHPGVNLKNKAGLLAPIIEAGLDAIEAFSSYHDEATAQYFFEQCQKHRLLATSGSDFHGRVKPAIALGHPAYPRDEAQMYARLRDRGLI